MSPIRVFAAGMFIALLLFKPTFATAFVSSLSNITSALFEGKSTSPDPSPNPQAAHESNEASDSFAAKQDFMFEVITKIIERLDKLDLVKPAPTAPATNELQPQLAKEVAYNRALDEQDLLEARAGYSGSDPIVRARLKLPPKVPPFDLFMVNGEMDTVQFDREFAAKH